MFLILIATLAAPQNFQADYGFAIKGGSIVQGAILTWSPVPGADNYIVSWTDHPDINNPGVWSDIALTWEPEHIDDAPRRKDIPQNYRVRAVNRSIPQDPAWTEPQQVIFPSFVSTGETGYSIPFYHFPDFRIILPVSSVPRTATGEWVDQVGDSWSDAPWQSPKDHQFFRIVVQ